MNLDKLRSKIVDRGLNSAELVTQMTDAELLEFLFLPGFSTAKAVTEFSGRGVGLDVVQDTIRKVGGIVRISSQVGRGTTFHLQLPLTLSVIRAVVVDVPANRTPSRTRESIVCSACRVPPCVLSNTGSSSRLTARTSALSSPRNCSICRPCRR